MRLKKTDEERYQHYCETQLKRKRDGKPTTLRTFDGWKKQREASKRNLAKWRARPEWTKEQNEKSRLRNKKNWQQNYERHVQWTRENYEEWRYKRSAQRRRRNTSDPAKYREQNRRYYEKTLPHLIAKLRRGDATISEVAQRVRRSFTRFDGYFNDGQTRGHQACLPDRKADTGTGKDEA